MRESDLARNVNASLATIARESRLLGDTLFLETRTLRSRIAVLLSTSGYAFCFWKIRYVCQSCSVRLLASSSSHPQSTRCSQDALAVLEQRTAHGFMNSSRSVAKSDSEATTALKMLCGPDYEFPNTRQYAQTTVLIA